MAHIWFISVFSINIFLELYHKNRSDYCKLDSHGDLLCGTREPWLAEAFNAIPWVMTGVLLWICIYFIARGILSKAWGSGFTPRHAKQIIVGALIISTAASVATWDVYDKGFWDAKGLLTIKDYDELESMRTQPVDVHVHDTNEFTDEFGWSETGIVPTTAWLDWGIYQPGREVIIDFSDSNGHQDASNGINAAAASTVLHMQIVG